MKKWLQREVRSKAHSRLNLVCLCSLLVMVLYVEVGKRTFSIEVAKSVPLLWKVLTFLVMFATLWYVDWRIQRRVFDLSVPALGSGWLVWLALVAFTFAVVSADVRLLFHIGTFFCLIFFWISNRYYERKGEKLREP